MHLIRNHNECEWPGLYGSAWVPRARATATVTGSFRPGVGGSFRFSATDSIIQIAGCGTECVTMQLHNARGKKLGGFVCDGFDDETEISPDRGASSPAFAATRSPCWMRPRGGQAVVSRTVPCRALGRPSVAFQAAAVRISSACEGRDPRGHSDRAIAPCSASISAGGGRTGAGVLRDAQSCS